ncbi:MAG TPA: T9SS type A sorting domain-containing protein [Ignavibacteriaceae bacterium]|nr:T9SS type A sorting domain-containing protein [Ignavibacteriaceae bacterium]
MLKLYNSLFAILFSICIFAQTDPNTDPNWDWVNGDYPGAPYPSSQYRMYIVNSNGVLTDVPITAPWGQGNAWIGLQDMKREDGWVLISRDFGTPNRAVWAQYFDGAPYFILYNKFKGILRLFIIVKSNQDLTSGALEIKFHQDNTFKTATLTHLKPRAYATDKLSNVQNNAGLALSQNMNDNWAWADYPMAYDPTFIATENGAWLDFQVIGTIESAIKVAGTGTGINGEQKAVRDFMTGTNNGAVTLTTASPEVNTTINFNQFTTSVFGTASSWDKWQQTIIDFNKKLPILDNPSPISVVNNNLKLFLNNIENNWLFKGIPFIGAAVGLVDFLVGGGEKNDQTIQPSFTGMNLALNGSITTTLKLPNPRRIQVPSSKLNPNVAVFGSNTPLVYNSNVGVLNLTSTPVVKYKTYYQSYGNNLSRQYIDCQMQDNLNIAVNPASGLTIDSIMACIVMDPSKNVNLQNPTSDPDLNLLATWTTGTNPKLALESSLEGRFIFSSKMVPYDAFKYQRVQGPIGNYTPDITIKIKAILHRTDDPTAQPVLMVLTYEPDLVADGTGNYLEPFYVKVSRVFEFDTDQVQPSVFGFGANPASVSTPSTIGNYVFAGWSDGGNELNRTFSSTTNVQAIYKYINNTNQSAALTYNGQRKCVKALENNHLLLVYESMGKIWIEKSTNNGGTWVLGNGGKPISTATAKHPSISQVGEHKFVIVYQKLNFGGSFNIVASYYNLYADDIKDEKIVAERLDKEFSDEATVVIGNSRAGLTDFLIIWHEEFYGGLSPEGGLYYRLGRITTNPDNPYGIIEFLTNGFIGSTSASSVNPTIACKDEQIYYPIKFHLVWQNNVSTSASTIRYREITYNGQQLTLGTEQVLSNGSGYTKNHNPSTTVMNDNIPRVTWRGERTVIHEEEKEILDKIQSTTTESKVLFTDPSVSYFWGFGSNVGKPTINRSTDNLKYYMAWSEPYQGAPNGKSVDNTLNSINIKTLSGLTGTDIQVVNGATGSQMYAVSLNNSSGLPYYFQISNVVPSQMEKEELVLSGIGREGVVYNGSAQFYFMIGDVIVNGSEVDFVDVPASTVFSSDSVLNRYMQTETFTLDNSSEFLYSVQYGITDSAAVDNYLQNGNSISFAVELIDAATGALLGKFDEVTYNSQNIYQYDNLSYEVNTEGIGNREVYLRLATNNNGNVSRSLTIVGADASLIAKRHTKKVGFNGIAAVTDYALSQNYPNPFNPVTTINYQIPKDGFVSLKVYDILGKEIATLVNSDKAQGKYTVEFDGSRFASGMYIYKLQSGDFVETRKMMLLK